jgi:RNA polymerase sigma-70 factor (ECF subfamily)
MPGPPPVDGSDFRELVADAQRGSGLAMRRIHDWLSGAVAGYMRSQGVADPEAAANEVFFRAFTRLDGFRGDAAGFRSWVFTIAHNLVIDERRKAARRPRTRAVPDGETLERLAGPAPPAPEPGEGLGGVAELLAALSQAQRDVLFLRVIAGLGVAETAQVLGRPKGAVKALQHRALTKLRRILADRGVTDSSVSTFPPMT